MLVASRRVILRTTRALVLCSYDHTEREAAFTTKKKRDAEASRRCEVIRLSGCRMVRGCGFALRVFASFRCRMFRDRLLDSGRIDAIAAWRFPGADRVDLFLLAERQNP